MNTETTASQWLDNELNNIGLSQNEFAAKNNISSSAISMFRAGSGGAQTAVDIAVGLGISPLVTLALTGKIKKPVMDDQRERMITTYDALNGNNKNMLLVFARFLYEKQYR